MRFPEIIYSPADKDVQSGLTPQRVMRHLLATTALAENTFLELPVPLDRVLVVTAIALNGATAGVTTVNNVKVSVVDTQLNVLYFRQHTLPPSFSEEVNIDDCEWVLLPGESLRATITYSAGAVGNIIEFSYMGILISRGNFQFGGL